MPGRDELIQQNIARAQANSQAPSPQESKGQAPISSVSGAPRSFFGGNLEVYSALDKIGFQGALGDSSMRGNTAYIRVWKRAGTAQQAANTAPAVNTPNDTWTELSKRIWDVQTPLPLLANKDVKFDTTFDPKSFASIYNDPAVWTTNFDLGIATPKYSVNTADTSKASQRQKSVGAQTPSSVKSKPSTTTVAVPAKPSKGASVQSVVGAVKSANPSGLLSSLSGKKTPPAAGPSSSSIKYSGGAMGSGTVAPPVSGEMMWQFLFNPSEMELEVGPEFKNADTWGVSEKSNSGQPLHWSHNKNAQLKFNSVLLNGFIFGRKVEALEQGLIELFMSRDGAGQDGPHVLEFVWGKRVFGPCVIRNVNIKEKMWDEGEVVNAELSFTLEQVPEWTINDGFVDVARPGRLSTEGSPTTPGSSASSPSGKSAGAGAGAGDNSDQKSKKPSKGLSERTCERAYYYTGLFTQFRTRMKSIGGFLNIASSYSQYERIMSEFQIKYQDAVQELGSDFGSPSQVKGMYQTIQSVVDPDKGLIPTEIENRLVPIIQGAVNKAGSIYNSPTKCPSTKGSTVQPARSGIRGVNSTLSTPTNL